MKTKTYNAYRALTWGLFLFCLLLSLGCDKDGKAEKHALENVPGVSDKTIRIGSSLALSGHASYLGIQTLRGAKSYINDINAKGGVHGRKIQIIALDDSYDPPLCLANTQKLIVEEDVFALFSYVGTPTTVKILPLVEKAKIPLIGMFTGATDLRAPTNPYVINVRASYYQETAQAVKHLVEDLGLRRIAVFYQYDAYGFDGLRGSELGLQKYGLEPVAKGSFIRGTLDVEDALEKILSANPDAVLMIGTYKPCAKFIRLAREKKKNLLFYNVSFVGGEELMRLLGQQGDGVIVSQVVPLPGHPLTRTLLNDLDRYIELYAKYYPGQRTNTVSLEGFYNAMVLVEGLKRAGRNLTRDGFVKAIETIKNFPLGADTILSFGPDDHQGLDRVYFTKIEDGYLAPITDWMAYSEKYVRTENK